MIMEGFNTWIPETYQMALGWMIIHALWQIAGIGMLLWLSHRVFQYKSAAFKYRLSITSLLVIAMSSILTFSYYSGRETNANSQNGIMLTQNLETSITDFSQAEFEQMLSKDNPLAFALLIQRLEKGLPTLVNIWLIGTLLFLFRLGRGLADIRNLGTKTHEHPDPKWATFLESQMRKLGIRTKISLFQSIHVDVPLAYGIFKPVILIPASLILQLSPAQLEAILTHELAHIKRHDYLLNLFQSFLEVVFFFHPVFWWINKVAREQRENACDDLAIQLDIKPKDLAYGLANVLNHAQTKAPEIAMAAAKATNPTLDRIKRIMGIHSSPSQPSTSISITMIITLLLSATLLVGASEEGQKASIEELIATELKTSIIEKTWANPNPGLIGIDTISFSKKDTIPAKKWEEMTEQEQEKMKKELAQWKSINNLNFKDLEPAFDNLNELLMNFKDSNFIFGDSMNNSKNNKYIVKVNSNFIFEDSMNLPQMAFPNIPIPNFYFKKLPKLELNYEQFEVPLPDSAFFNTIPSIGFELGDSTWKSFSLGSMSFEMDTSKSKQEGEQMIRELHGKFAAQSEERKESLQKMQKKRETMQKGMGKKREVYYYQIEPQIKEFQAKIQEWQKENEPMLQEYQAKMKAWQAENQPKMDEFQKQMESWHKENQVQLKAFEKKMEEWQKNHQKELKELHQKRIEKNGKKELN